MVRVVGEMLQVYVSEGQRITLKIIGIFLVGLWVTHVLSCAFWRHLHGWRQTLPLRGSVTPAKSHLPV